MGLLTFALNVTLDGCCDHREMAADDEMLRYWTRVMDAAGAMLFGRRTYELMEDAWPQVARDPEAAPSHRDWAAKVHPVVAGHGPFLFSCLQPSLRLKLVAATRLKSGIVALHYRRLY
jgi:hypothetical protein